MVHQVCVLSVVVAMAMGSSVANAGGIVNVQSILATDADPGLSGGVKLSADWRTGNTELLVLGAAPVARYRVGSSLFIAIVSGEFGRSRGDRIIAKTFEHLRYRYDFSDRIGAELFGQHAFDQFRRIRLRALVGAGPRFGLVRRKDFRLSIGVAYMLEYEKLRTDTAADAGDTDVQHRASSYATGSYKLDNNIQIVETLYFQPRLSNVGDLRLLNETQLVVNLTQAVALTTSFSIAYDTEPPDTIEGLDTALKSAVTVTF